MLYEYDATEDCCPLPLVKTRQILKKMAWGDRCLVKISDSGSKINMPQFLTKQGFTFKVTPLTETIIEIDIRT